MASAVSVDFEEGEIIDSDNETRNLPLELEAGAAGSNVGIEEPSSTTFADLVTSPREYRLSDPTQSVYRSSNKPAFDSNSDADSSSDDDRGTFNTKRPNMRGDREGKHMQCDSLWENPNLDKKKNNIWGTVVADQTLAHTVGAVNVWKNVDNNEDNEERGVEEYDYTKAKLDPRNDIIPELPDIPDKTSDVEEDLCDRECFGFEKDQKKNFSVKDRLGSSRKRKAVSLKSRIGVRTYDSTKCRDHIPLTVESSHEEVGKILVQLLDEPVEKINTFTQISVVLGQKKALELLYITEDLEDAGGIMVNDGSRRRTPGGVLLTIMKDDPDVTKQQINAIFGEERKQEKKHRTQQAKRRRDRVANMDFASKQQQNIPRIRDAMSSHIESKNMEKDSPNPVSKAVKLDAGVADCPDAHGRETVGYGDMDDFMDDESANIELELA